MKEFYSNIMNNPNNNIIVKDYLNNLINKIISNPDKEYCKLLNQLYLIIYNKIGYKLYDDKNFELIL